MSGQAGRAHGSGSVLDGPGEREWWGVPPGDTIRDNVRLGESSGLGESISQRFAMQEAGKDRGEARHEIELGTHEDASIRVEIDASGIWGHKDIALQCVGPAVQGMGSGRH